MHRALVAGVIGFVAVALSAAPAAADPARPGNVASHVTVITPATPAIEADIVGGSAFLRLRVRPGATVTVIGYEGEPYLRVAADGTVEENTRSKTTYLNRSLSGGVEIPPSADDRAAPEWRRVDDGGTYAWHDHRVHWMGAGEPVAPQDWQVPLLVDGASVVVNGRYAAVGAPSPMPWWLVAVAALVGVAVIGTRRRRLAAVAVAVAAVVGVPVALAIARLPSSGVGDWSGVAMLAVAVGAAVVAAVTDGGAWLVGAGLGVLLWAGRRLNVLDHAVLVTDLPAWLDRLAVAVGCGVGIAAVVVGVRAVVGPLSPSAAPRPG